MSVSRDDLHAYLERVAAECKNPRAGLFGPDTKFWEINREALVFLGGGRAVLLQTAHPFVAHGVDQHSKTKTDPLGRGQRTFMNVFAMVFGDLQTATKCAKRVHAIHDRIHGAISERVGAFDNGSRYDANDEDALFWVSATLWDTAMQVHELMHGPVSLADKNRYFEESKKFSYLFGIPDSAMSKDWTEFEAYNRRMWASDTLAVGRPARDLYRFLFSTPEPWQQPIMDWFKIMTAGLLPPRVRHMYGMDFGWAEQRIFNVSIRAIRMGVKVLPDSVRYLPAYNDALRRIKGIEGRGTLSLLLDKAVATGRKKTKATAEAA